MGQKHHVFPILRNIFKGNSKKEGGGKVSFDLKKSSHNFNIFLKMSHSIVNG